VIPDNLVCVLNGLGSGIGPIQDLLGRRLATGPACKTDESNLSSHRGGKIDRKGRRERVRRIGEICNGHGQRQSAIAHLDLENISAVKIDATGKGSRKAPSEGGVHCECRDRNAGRHRCRAHGDRGRFPMDQGFPNQRASWKIVQVSLVPFRDFAWNV
jgi:hypothetical protein